MTPAQKRRLRVLVAVLRRKLRAARERGRRLREWLR
jgi:hypothetical protein